VDDAPPSPEAEMLSQLIVELMRRDIVPVEAVADHFDAEAEHAEYEDEKEANANKAHLARCLIVHAAAEPSAQQRARARRERIRLVQTARIAADGGNEAG
jgi:hypothetical protein